MNGVVRKNWPPSAVRPMWDAQSSSGLMVISFGLFFSARAEGPGAGALDFGTRCQGDTNFLERRRNSALDAGNRARRLSRCVENASQLNLSDFRSLGSASLRLVAIS